MNITERILSGDGGGTKLYRYLVTPSFIEPPTGQYKIISLPFSILRIIDGALTPIFHTDQQMYISGFRSAGSSIDAFYIISDLSNATTLADFSNAKIAFVCCNQGETLAWGGGVMLESPMDEITCFRRVELINDDGIGLFVFDEIVVSNARVNDLVFVNEERRIDLRYYYNFTLGQPEEI